MKINRWISLPLYFTISYPLLMSISGLIFGMPFDLTTIIGWGVGGFLMAVILQLWGDLRTRKFSENKDEKDFSVIQNRKLTLLMKKEAAFDLCMDSIADVSAKVVNKNIEKGFIKAKTKMNFHSFGTEITFNLSQIADNLTEVEVQTRPSVKTTMVDYGESLRIIQEINQNLKEKDAEINKKVLADSTSILDEIYVKPFQKEKVER